MREGGAAAKGRTSRLGRWLGGTLLQLQRAWRGGRAPHTAEGSVCVGGEGQRDGRSESAGSAGF